MEWASEQSAGGMMTVLYGPQTKLGAACTEAKQSAVANGIDNPECAVSNYLFPHCKVISGHVEVSNDLNQSEICIGRIRQ